MLFLNEVRFAIRQPFLMLTILAMSLFFVVIGFGGIEPGATQSDVLQVFSFIQMLLLPFAIAILSTEIFVRDINSNMQELINSTPLNLKKRYLIRLTSHMVFASIPFCLGLLLISFLHFELSESLQLFCVAFLFIFLPNLLFLSSIVVFVAIYSASNFSTYAFSALIGVGYMILGSMLGFPFLAGSSIVSESLYNVMIWLDPLATTTLLHIAGTDAIVFSKEIFLNRLASLTFSVVAIWLTLRTTSTPKLATKRTKKTSSTKTRQGFIKPPKSQLSAMVLCSIGTILRSRVNQLILLLWLGITFNEVLSGLMASQQNGKYQLTSIDAINFIASDLLLAYGAIVIAFWSWLVCWNAKKMDFAEIIASTPVSNVTRIAAQFITMAILVLIVAFLAAASTLLAEIGLNTRVMINQYLFLFAIAIVPLMLLSALCVLIHNIVSSAAKAGAILTALLVIKFTPITSSLGLTHLLWNIVGSPVQEANNFWGVDGSISVLPPFVLFWLLIITALFLFALERSHRGTGLLNRHSRRYLILPLSFALLSLGSAFYIDKQLTTEKPLTYQAQQDAWQVYYEDNYKDWQLKQQPTLTHVNSTVDLYPSRGAAKFALQYRLLNNTSQPISDILIGRYGNYSSWEIPESPAFNVIEDPYSQQKIVQLEQQLLPGEQMLLNIDIDYQQPTLWPVNSSVVVKNRFTTILSENFLPRIGYQADFETGLSDITQNTKITYSTTISTSETHSPVSHGRLEKQWVENERTYVSYVSDTASEFKFAWSSLPTNSAYTQSKNKAVSLYAPAHFKASNEVIEVVSDTLEYLNTYLATNTTLRLNIVAAPDVQGMFYNVSGLLLLDYDSVLRHLTYQNENLPLIYRQIFTPLIEQVLIANQIDQSSQSATLLKEHALLTIIEQHFGNEARKKVLAAAVKQHTLLSLQAANSKTSQLSETETLTESLHAMWLSQQLEDIVGKGNMRNALQRALIDSENKTLSHIIALLKKSQSGTNQKQIDQVFADFMAAPD